MKASYVLLVTSLAVAVVATGFGGKSSLPPRTVLSADVTNSARFAVEVTATYRWPPGSERQVTKVVEAGQSVEFDVITVREGSAFFAGDIVRFDVRTDAGRDPVTVEGPFPTVKSPTKHHRVAIVDENETLSVVA